MVMLFFTFVPIARDLFVMLVLLLLMLMFAHLVVLLLMLFWLLMMWFVVVVARTIVDAVDAAFHSGTKHGYGAQIARLTGNAGGVVRLPP
jgi:hypothetical protein